MLFGGIQKATLVDYPGKVATTLFTIGCPLRCRFCYNPELVIPEQYATPLPEDEILSFLAKRVGYVQAVCVTGGEPTVQPDLRPFLARIKALGYLVKLDSNGVNPHLLEPILADGNVDYVAMDIKGPLASYYAIVGGVEVTKQIQRSIDLLMRSGVDYEFRTTVSKPLLAVDDFHAIGQLIKGAPRYFMQNYVAAGKQIDQEAVLQPFTSDELTQAKTIMQTYVALVETR
jgi:pyruvate formate lyase activating enzyme